MSNSTNNLVGKIPGWIFMSFILCLGMFPEQKFQPISTVDAKERSSVTQEDQKENISSRMIKFDPVHSEDPVAECIKGMDQGGLYKEVADFLVPWSIQVKDSDISEEKLAHAVHLSIQCLNELHRQAESDDYLEKMVATHGNQPFVLAAVARCYLNLEETGVILDGKFVRDYRRNAKSVFSGERDRVRALQIMLKAMKLIEKEGEKIPAKLRGDFYSQFAEIYQRSPVWKWQVLTDLATLPDYDDNRWRYHDSSDQFAPVDAQGNPIYYDIPDSFESAKNDGQRWRWLLEQSAKCDDHFRFDAMMTRADFLYRQFGVQTLSRYNRFFPANSVKQDDTKDGIWSLHTLTDHETIAKRADGIKRFTLPDDQNYILLYQEVFGKGSKEQKISAGSNLAEEYLNRRQYPQAVKIYQQMLDLAGPGDNFDHIKEELHQIIGNWGTFENTDSFANGSDVKLSYRFRNGTAATFTATPINIPLLLEDIKDYIRSEEKKQTDQLNWSRLQLANIGYQFLSWEGKEKYLGKETARWTVALKPLKDHFDGKETITLPFKTPGAWLIRANMEGGNNDMIVVWINDTVLVQKQLDQGVMYYAADAQTGQSIPNIKLDFFGFSTEEKRTGALNRDRQRFIKTASFNETTDENGLVVINSEKIQKGNGQWLVTIKGNESEESRFAWLGFDRIWFRSLDDSTFSRARAYFISDRPVYRPEQKVQFKFWVGTAQYDQTNTKDYANFPVLVKIYDPQNTPVFDKTVKLDAYGGMTHSLALPKNAALGSYRVEILESLDGRGITEKIVGTVKRAVGSSRKYGKHLGSGYFRVEEYKKPEFEVTVDTPQDPVSLGDAFTAKIQAHYYFGAPVTEATVEYKVTRTKKSTSWFPVRPWDWFYGNGYWWFGIDYDWFPGWNSWGCPAPRWPWMPLRHAAPPELVVRNEVPIGKDGSVEVKIDSALARELFPDDDQEYEITAEVVDQSRRTIVGSGKILVAKKPFKVYAWTDRGFYHVNDVVQASFQSRRIDGKPVTGKAEIELRKISYRSEKQDGNIIPVEIKVHSESLSLNEEGQTTAKLQAGEPGQYRLVCYVTDTKGKREEGGYVFTVLGASNQENTLPVSFQFNALELVPNQAEYQPGNKVQLMVNTSQADSNVLLFVRSSNGITTMPKFLALNGKSTQIEIPVERNDMPNFFIEALTVSDGKVYTQQREIVVPPEKQVLDVTIQPDSKTYRPGKKAQAEIKVLDLSGKPVMGQVVVSIYDKSVEYISQGGNTSDIKEFFWKWRRNSSPTCRQNVGIHSSHFTPEGEKPQQPLGLFGNMFFDFDGEMGGGNGGMTYEARSVTRVRVSPDNPDNLITESLSAMDAVPMAAGKILSNGSSMSKAAAPDSILAKNNFAGGIQEDTKASDQPMIRTNFADTAYWNAMLETNKDGIAHIELDMPENLTTWKIKVWTCSSGVRVGQGETEVITKKNLLIRLQRPRFLVQNDIATISANVHNYLAGEKEVQISLELPKRDKALDSCLTLMENNATVTAKIPAGGEKRVDWKVRADRMGSTDIIMKALTDEESDAIQERIPIYTHGMTKQVAVSGMIPRRDSANSPVEQSFEIEVPKERKPDESRLTVRFSPTLAGAMIDALPYLADYPYGCTEQTLNRFLPTVLVHKTLEETGINLADLAKRRANLNSQELGDAKERASQWNKKGASYEAVYDKATVAMMAKEGLDKLVRMQCSDGGWGWMSGSGEHSNAHLTALVTRGLDLARKAEMQVNSNSLASAKNWLVQYQTEETKKLFNGRFRNDEWKKQNRSQWKSSPDNTDALVYATLAQLGNQPDNDLNPDSLQGVSTNEIKEPAQITAFMKNAIWKERARLSLYSVALFGLALVDESAKVNREEIAELTRMLEQFLKVDPENQTARLDLAGRHGGRWWCWYGDEIETQAAYLKLLANTNPHGEIAPQLVKYLLNNRKNATYWNSTRDTAMCIEAFTDYLRTTGEISGKTQVEILIDGKNVKRVEITPDHIFEIDNTFEWLGKDVTDGKHLVTIRQTGNGPLYYNAYLEYYTMEDPIAKTGLEVKVERRYWLLEEADSTTLVAGGHGQVVSQRTGKYKKTPLASLKDVVSGQLVEVELIVESKNNYESILLEDMKPAGFEPLEVRSGYNGNALGAYVEFRDERVCFFVNQLSQGTSSVTYRLRAEQPGSFSALPAKIWGMYAPELKGNSDEFKVKIQ